MGIIRYFKGYSKKDGRQMIFKVFDEPQKKLLTDEEYMVEASAVEKTGLTHYKTLNQCELSNYVLREITESEYESYVLIQHLLTEMFLHDFTGGFPRFATVKGITRTLTKQIDTWLNDVFREENVYE